MSTLRQRLWKWLIQGDRQSVGTLATLVVSLLIGSYVFLLMAGVAMLARTSSQIYFTFCVGGFGGALVTGFVCGFIHPRQALIWSTGFSWPLMLWGLFCLPFALFEGPGLLIWLAMAFAMAALCILGAMLSRRLRR